MWVQGLWVQGRFQGCPCVRRSHPPPLGRGQGEGFGALATPARPCSRLESRGWPTPACAHTRTHACAHNHTPPPGPCSAPRRASAPRWATCWSTYSAWACTSLYNQRYGPRTASDTAVQHLRTAAGQPVRYLDRLGSPVQSSPVQGGWVGAWLVSPASGWVGTAWGRRQRPRPCAGLAGELYVSAAGPRGWRWPTTAKPRPRAR